MTGSLPVKECQQILRDTAAVVQQSRPSVADSDVVGVVVARVIDRAANLFEGVYLLLEDGQSENAFVLARPLFEESVWLLEVSDSDESTRLAYALGWWHEGAKKKLELYQQTLMYDPRAATETPRLTETEMQRIQGLAREYGATILKPPKTKPLAEKHGLMVDFTKYLLAHQFVHGSLVAAQVRTSVHERNDNETLVTIGAASPVIWCEDALFSCRYVLRATKAACNILGKAPNSQISVLESRLAVADDENT